ncbi:MAG: thiamine pyrophosphate-dependent enzyme [Halobacteriales archaeon]
MTPRDMANDRSAGGVPWLSQDDLPVDTYQVVAPDGSYDPAAVPDLDDDALLELYRWMRTERRLAERFVSLQRRGQLGTVASGRGQEASIAGSGYALGDDDWLLGMGRETVAHLIQGASIEDFVLYWRGIEDAARRLAENRCMMAIAIGSHLPMTTGVAWGMDLTDDDAVVAAYFGDGATSTGAVHEAVNMAGVLDVPAVFFCQNNQWAISTPFEKQTNAETLAQRAVGYGIEGVRVDGNDVLAVYAAMRAARERARQGKPVFVESLTYRRDAHTTSDDPSRYRDEDDVEPWRDRDPIDRYEAFLEAEGLGDRVDPDAVDEEIDARIDEAVAAADDVPERDVDELFTHLYAELPPALERQRDELEALLDERPAIAEHVEQRPKG